eukprot:TRINITY_DN13557_c0_g1_i1.p1 TRINITY_DN13557_c0_g1~~TRINITY_DN13557_c0_g1_i1.p1  ORF type:complete len:398 (-),score=23.29 TRINITY_DN13557_c0_g1_i1:205-1398(-)
MATWRDDKARSIKVVLAIMLWWLMLSTIVVYNKMVFSGKVCVDGNCAERFPYPIASAFIQLSFVGVLLSFASAASHVFYVVESPCVCGPHIAYKLKHIAPVGLSFGLFVGLSHWGLALVPAEEHVLLQSTQLFWALLFARVLNKERLDVLECCAVVLVLIGTMLISLSANPHLSGSRLGLIVNWTVPVFEALYLCLLRLGAAELSRPDNCLHGSMSPFEFTGIKCMCSSAVVVVMASIFECPAMLAAEGGAKTESWWNALVHYPFGSVCLLLGGGLIMLTAQVIITWLAGLASATTISVAGEVRIVPQWLFSALFFTPDLSMMHIIGAAVAVIGTILYATFSSLSRKLTLSTQGLQWHSRDCAEEKSANACEESTESSDVSDGQCWTDCTSSPHHRV